MESSSGGRRRLRFVLLAAGAFFGAVGLVLLACGGHALHKTKTPTDVAAGAEETGTQGSDANAPVTDTKAPPRENTGMIATDSSSSPCSTVSGTYGACDTVLGWGFDGKVCRQWSGCDCAPDCARLYPTALACAQACRTQGGCNSEALISQGIARFELGRSCDSLVACVPAGLEGEMGLELASSCQSAGDCADLQTCPLKVPSVIDQTLWDGYCTASLISGVRIECFRGLL